MASTDTLGVGWAPTIGADLVTYLRDAIATHEATATALATLTPKVLDGHSDGKRVRYVRETVTADTLRAVLAIVCTHDGRWSTGPDGGARVCGTCGTVAA